MVSLKGMKWKTFFSFSSIQPENLQRKSHYRIFSQEKKTNIRFHSVKVKVGIDIFSFFFFIKKSKVLSLCDEPSSISISLLFY